MNLTVFVLSILFSSCSSYKPVTTGSPYEQAYRNHKARQNYAPAIGGFFVSGGTLLSLRADNETAFNAGNVLVGLGGVAFLSGLGGNEADRALLNLIKEQSSQKSDTIYIQQGTSDDILPRIAKLEKYRVDTDRKAEEIDKSLNQYITVTDGQILQINSNLDKIKVYDSKINAVNTQPSIQHTIAKEPIVTQTTAPPKLTQTQQRVSAPSYRYRTVQFVATVPGKSYSHLDYLGDLITEQVPGKSLVRYKIGGNFSDADILRVISNLSDHGFKGAYEN